MCNPNNCDLKIGSAIQFPLRSAQDRARPRHHAPRVLRRLVRQGFLFVRDGSSFVAIAIAIAIAIDIDIDSGIVQAEMAMAKATKLEPSCRDCHCHCHWDFPDNPNSNGNVNKTGTISIEAKNIQQHYLFCRNLHYYNGIQTQRNHQHTFALLNNYSIWSKIWALDNVFSG